MRLFHIFAALALFAAHPLASAQAVLNPGDTLRVTFSVTNPTCPGGPCDVLFTFPSADTSLSVVPNGGSLFNGPTLLGTDSGVYGPEFRASSSLFMENSATVDFTSIDNGSIQGVITFSIASGQLIWKGQPGMSLYLGHGTGPGSSNGGTGLTITSSSIISALAQTCAPIVQSAVTLSLGGYGQGSLLNLFNPTQMEATFTPNLGLTLGQAASLCGFSNFDWEQIITNLPDPSPYYLADNVTHLTSASTPFNDPPLGGYAFCVPLFGVPCNQYPFYLDPNAIGTLNSLDKYETSTQLSFFDSASDHCLPGGNSSGVRGCNGLNAPAGSFLAFTTRLVGILPNGTLVPLPNAWTWTSTFNGTSGGVATTLNFLPVDPGSGTGGVTITSINGVQLPPVVPASQAKTTSSGLAYSRISQTFNGTVTITNISGTAISGPLQILFTGMPANATLVNATSSLSGTPYLTVPAIAALAPGQSVTVSVQFKNPSNATLNLTPVIYSGSIN